MEPLVGHAQTLACRALLQDLHGRQFLALEELEESTACSRNIGHLVINVILLDGCDRVAATS